MNRLQRVALVLTVLVFFSNISGAQPVSPARDRVLFEQLNSYGNALYSLAGERFAFHESKKETWVLHVHQSSDPKSLIKFRQGNLFVASIPVTDIGRHGARLYATRYNTLTLQKADDLAVAGKYAEALEIYRVVYQFGLGLDHSDQIKHRIECTEKLLKNEDTQKNLKAIKAMLTNHANSTFELLETKEATVTTNLLTIEIPGQQLEQPDDDEADKNKTQ